VSGWGRTSSINIDFYCTFSWGHPFSLASTPSGQAPCCCARSSTQSPNHRNVDMCIISCLALLGVLRSGFSEETQSSHQLAWIHRVSRGSPRQPMSHLPRLASGCQTCSVAIFKLHPSLYRRYVPFNGYITHFVVRSYS
jgi:hypothetical protein